MIIDPEYFSLFHKCSTICQTSLFQAISSISDALNFTFIVEFKSPNILFKGLAFV
jgi:hypothetical protein